LPVRFERKRSLEMGGDHLHLFLHSTKVLRDEFCRSESEVERREQFSQRRIYLVNPQIYKALSEITGRPNMAVFYDRGFDLYAESCTH